ncbi:unnamed protein product [Peronospora belbahrii]|uniref:PB1 domain-containing protein n=1 Tax=Peronospora belbahrii TaxID=622444 RepID=A0AAU9LAA4_9STRA|nr:unnamed protein product [Peronospora belbahrii]CAH0522017.1 unnamed protein product [Peronospora belbahrii]
MTSQQVALKIAFNGDIHRLRVDLRDFSLTHLTQIMATTFHQPVGDFVVQYRDPEGDCVNVTTDAEFQEAVRVFMSTQDSIKSLKFSAITRRQVEFQEQVVDPLITSVEHLMQALAVMVEKLKQDATPAPTTKVTLKPIMKDNAGELPKTAAGGFSSFAQGFVGQINRFIPEKKAGEATAAPVAAAFAVPVATCKLEEKQQQPLLDVVTVPPSACVEDAPPAQDTEETLSVASSVAFSESEVKWADQLSIVNGIFPNRSPARIIDILEKSDGDLNVVLNVLTEEN